MSVKKPLAIVATAAMVMTGASFGSAAASAAPITGPEYTPSSDILATTGDTESAAYNSWHFDPSRGQVVEQARNGIVVAGSAAVPGDVLIVQGNGNDVTPGTDSTGLAEVLGELAVSASSTDKVQYQVPVRVDVNEDGVYTAGTDQWSTLRASVADPSVWTTSKAIGEIGANKTGTIEQFAGIAGIYPIATGLLVQKNTANVLVSSFTNGDTVTKFYAAPTAPSIGLETLEYAAAADIRPDESTYAGWHNGAPAGGSFATVEGAHGATTGLEVTGKAQILNGFADDQFQNGGLEFANDLAIEVAAGGDAVFAQIPVFYYVDGQERQFTTLRAEVPAGEFTNDTVWTNSGSVAGIAGNQGTIAQYTEAMGQHDVIGYGFFVDTGKKATVTSISFNGATTNFAKAADPLEPAVPGEATTTYVDAEGIRPNEESYAGWHDGTTKTATERNFKTLAGAHGATTGLKVSGKAQILNGFADADFQRNALEFANGMTVTVAAGSDKVFAQLPVFYGQDGKSFTTLRAEVTADGFTADTVWTNSGTVVGIIGNKGTIAQYTEALGKHDVIGYGFFVDTGKKATVTSISFNGATTNFAKAADPIDPAVPGAESTTYLEAEGIRPNEAEYAGWHDGVTKDSTKRNFETLTRANGATTGLRVNGKSQILNGFADADFQRNALNFADEMTVTVAAGSDAVFAQIPVFYGKNGDTFATLRAEVPASGKLADVAEWTTSKAIAGSDIKANEAASLESIIDAMGNHDVIGYGFFVDTGKKATVTSVSFNGATTNFTKVADPLDPAAPGAESTTYVDAAGIRPNEAEYAGWHDGVTKDSTKRNFSTVAGKNGATLGLKVNGKSQILNGFADADFQRNALTFADGMTVKVKAGSDDVFAQLPVFYGKNKTFTTLRAAVPANGKLADVAEWTTSKAIVGSDVQANEAASLESIIEAMGNHDVIGYGFFVDTAKSATVESISFNGATTNFTKAEKPVKPKPPVKLTDVSPKTTKFVADINWMVNSGITTGIKQPNGSFKFEPAAHVTREAMAAFLYRTFATKADKAASAPKVSPFADVKTTDKFYKEIAWMSTKKYSTGVKQPVGKSHFQPKANITREAMAAFIYRINGGPSSPVPTGSIFTDVKPGHKFFKEIAWLGDTGLSTGFKQSNGSKIYGPQLNTTREAMAAFLHRAYKKF